MLNHLDLFKVRLLYEVAQCGSVTGAASILRVTPSAVSQNIQLLERVAGKSLFVRTEKKMIPTQFGEKIIEHARRFYSELSDVIDSALLPENEIRIGAPPVFAATVLLDHLQAFTSTHPNARILVNVIDTKRLVTDLLELKVDLAFIDVWPGLTKIPELAVDPFWEEELLLCCSKEFYVAHRLSGEVTLKKLELLPHVPYHREREGIYKWYDYHFGRVPAFPFKLAVDSPQAVMAAVLKGWGLGVLPRSLVEPSLRERQLMIIRGPRGSFSSQMVIAQNKGRIPSRLEKSFLAMVRQAVSTRKRSKAK